jgi:hypothetical protein
MNMFEAVFIRAVVYHNHTVSLQLNLAQNGQENPLRGVGNNHRADILVRRGNW